MARTSHDGPTEVLLPGQVPLRALRWDSGPTNAIPTFHVRGLGSGAWGQFSHCCTLVRTLCRTIRPTVAKWISKMFRDAPIAVGAGLVGGDDSSVAVG
jgi:hypothetical protein